MTEMVAYLLGATGNPQVVDDGAHALPVSATISQAPVATAPFTEQTINFAAAGDTVIVAPVGGQSTKVYGLRINVQGPTIIQVKNGAGTVLETWFLSAAGSGFILDFRTAPYYKTSINTAFILNSSVAVQVNGMVEFLTNAL